MTGQLSVRSLGTDQEGTEQYLKLLERYTVIMVCLYVIWLFNPASNKDWGKCCYTDIQCLQEAEGPRWKSYMLVLSCCPEPDIETTLSECCVPVTELFWSLQR